MLILVALTLVLRDVDVWRRPHFFAEDGEVFWVEQAYFGWTALLRPYNGYWHLLPRICAALVSLFPAGASPLLYAGAATVLESVTIGFFLLPENRLLVESDRLRGAVCLVLSAGLYLRNMTGNLLTLQWYLAPVAILVTLHVCFGSPGLLRERRHLYLGVLVLSALTAPMLLLLLPIIGWELLHRRPANPARWILLAFCGALMFQAAVVIAAGRVPVPGAIPRPLLRQTILQLPGAICNSWVYRVLATALVGHRHAIDYSIQFDLKLAVPATMLAGVFLTALRRRLGPWHFRLMLFGWMGSLALMGGPLLFRNLFSLYGSRGELQAFEGGVQYFIAPAWALFVIAAVSIERLKIHKSETVRAALFLGIFLLGISRNFWLPDRATRLWAPHVRSVERWLDARSQGAPDRGVVAPIEPAPWMVWLPALPER